MKAAPSREFPFLFGGTFIEGEQDNPKDAMTNNFPSFSEGLSLRDEDIVGDKVAALEISLPFRRDFH